MSKLAKWNPKVVEPPTGPPRAHLNIEDGENGQLNFQAVYVGGFNPDSPAHCAAALLTKHMDTLGERVQAKVDLAHDMLPRTVEGQQLPPGEVEILDKSPEVEVTEFDDSSSPAAETTH